MVNIAYLLFYDGTKFNGFTGHGYTIENVLKKVFRKNSGSDVKILKASRTDPGVSAICNVISISLPRIVIPDEVNNYLPDGIRLWGYSIVDNSFNPRKAIKRTYIYVKKWNGEDIEVMRNVAELFLGTHDLRNFLITDKEIKSTITTIYNIDIWYSNGYIFFKFVGKGFKNKMIRKIVWTLTQVGLHKLSPEYVKKLINLEIRQTVPSAKPEGLYLVHVDYGSKIKFSLSTRALNYIINYLRNRISIFESLKEIFYEMYSYFNELKLWNENELIL